MKITLAYLDGVEDERANKAAEALKQLLPSAKVKRSDRYAPYKHVYFTIRKPIKP